MTKGFNCFKYIEQLKLAPQMKFEIIIVSLICILFLIGIMTLKIYLNNLDLYKNIYNIIDYTEFNELNHIEFLVENEKIQLEESLKNEVLFLTNFYINLQHFGLNSLNFLGNINEINLNNLNINDYKNDDLNFFCFNKEKCLDSTNNLINDKYNSIIKNIGFYLKYLFINNKSFHYKPYDNFNVLLKEFYFIDFSNKLLISFNGRQKNYNITLNEIKNYIIKTIKKNFNNTILFNKIFSNNFSPYENIFRIPIFDSNKKNFPIFFDDSSSSSDSLDSSNYIEYLSFNIIPSKNQSDNNYVKLTENNLNEYIDKVFFIFGEENPNKVILDPLLLTTTGLTILNSDYLFPYKLSNKEYCYIIRTSNLSQKSIEQLNILNNLSNFTYLDQCFNKSKPISDSSKKLKKTLFLNEFFDNFKLFYRTDFNNIENFDLLSDNINQISLIREIEKNILFNNITTFNQIINSIILINDKQFKIKKSYCPLSIPYKLNYFYPFTDISLNFIIKDEGFSKYISKEFESLIKVILINCLIIIFLIILVLIVFLKILLSIFTKKISSQVNILNDTFFITGQSNQEELNKKNKETNIDEFKELIQIINEMVKGDINLKQIHNIKDEINYKLQRDEFNIEFEKNKIYNILVKEDNIENILEQGNFSSKILQQKTNDIKKDNFVKNSVIYKEQLEKNEKLNDERNDENNKNNDIDNLTSIKIKNLMFENKTEIFNDKGTLQNNNNILYLKFKEKYDKNWYKKYKKEIEEKKEKLKKHKKNNK